MKHTTVFPQANPAKKVIISNVTPFLRSVRYQKPAASTAAVIETSQSSGTQDTQNDDLVSSEQVMIEEEGALKCYLPTENQMRALKEEKQRKCLN